MRSFRLSIVGLVLSLVVGGLVGCAGDGRGASGAAASPAGVTGGADRTPVVVLFTKHGCWACTAFEPTYNRIKAEYKQRVRFVEKDVLSEGKAVAELHITDAPTLILFVKGHERGRLIGACTADEVRRLIERGR